MILVTGATGFVGTALIARLLADGLPVRAAIRRESALEKFKVETALVGDLSAETDWQEAVANVDAVIHTAARVHVMSDGASDPLMEYRRTNLHGTLRLARQAAEAGVRRFVFVSSIKANGEATLVGNAFSADGPTAPVDPYGVSKLEAEQALRELATQTGMEVVIVRPPLVYGPGVKANFRTMMSIVARRIPLPLGGITGNRRSMVSLDNLVDLLTTCVHHPAAGNQTFLVSDGEDLSTAQLLNRLGQAMGKPARLLPVPASWLERGASMLGRANVAQRLCGSLQVDISKTRRVLGWTPPITVDEGLRKAAEGYLREASF